jgi:hypothetical protein
MSDKPPPEPTPSADAGSPISATNISGAVRIGRRRPQVVVSFTNSQIGLVGIALMEGKRATFNLKTSKFTVYD